LSRKKKSKTEKLGEGAGKTTESLIQHGRKRNVRKGTESRPSMPAEKNRKKKKWEFRPKNILKEGGAGPHLTPATSRKNQETEATRKEVHRAQSKQ